MKSSKYYEINHTEYLRLKFGAITPEVLVQNNSFRICLLKDKYSVVRTFALTIFNELNGVNQAVYERIKDFTLISDALKSLGLSQKRTSVCFFKPTFRIGHFYSETPLIGRYSRIHILDADELVEFGELIEIYECDNANLDVGKSLTIQGDETVLFRLVNCFRIAGIIIDTDSIKLI